LQVSLIFKNSSHNIKSHSLSLKVNHFDISN